MAAGLDSLGAVELRNSLEAAFGLQLPGTLIFDYPTQDALVEYLSSKITAPAAEGRQAHVVPQPRAAPAAAKDSAKELRPHVVVKAAAARMPGDRDAGTASWAPMAADQVLPVPLERWDTDAHWVASLSGTGSVGPVRFGAWVPAADAFDAEAFGLSGSEAVLMDPQQRLLLECTAEVLMHSEQLGVPAGLGSNGTGVYVGLSSVDYLKLAMAHRQQLHRGEAVSGAEGTGLSAYSATGEPVALHVWRSSLCTKLRPCLHGRSIPVGGIRTGCLHLWASWPRHVCRHSLLVLIGGHPLCYERHP
jgi:hypothetical protein